MNHMFLNNHNHKHIYVMILMSLIHMTKDGTPHMTTAGFPPELHPVVPMDDSATVAIRLSENTPWEVPFLMGHEMIV